MKDEIWALFWKGVLELEQEYLKLLKDGKVKSSEYWNSANKQVSNNNREGDIGYKNKKRFVFKKGEWISMN